ncbi:MAG: hypothetical protein ACXVPU_08245 [Bacteroidia bacterium]
MKKIKIIVGVLGILFFCGCRTELTVNDFFKQVSEDKDYNRELVIDEFKLSCQYIPSELITLGELAKGRHGYKYNQMDFNDELKKYENTCYINLKIGLKDGQNIMIKGVSNQSDYAARLGELTYLLTNDCFILADGKDTIRALSCNFSNSFGNTPDTKFTLAFPRKKLADVKKNIDVMYVDRTFGISETAVFNYNMSDLNKEVPKIIEQK